MASFTSNGYIRHPDLALGFAVYSGFSRLDGTRMYFHLAVLPDDSMLITDEAFPLAEPDFDTNGRKWNTLHGSTVDEVLETPLGPDFHWLGNYRPPLG